MQEQRSSMMKDQNLILYPGKWKLQSMIALSLLFGFASLKYLTTFSEYFNSSDNTFFSFIKSMVVIFGIICSILMLIYASLIGVMCLYRLLIPFPSLVVDDEGIHITPFLLWQGMTTIAWTEIATISFRRVRFKLSPVVAVAWLQSFSCLFIAVIPQYEKVVFSRQNRFNKTLFQRSWSGVLSGIFIPQLLLPIAGKRLLAQFQIMYQVQIEQHNIKIEDTDFQRTLNSRSY